MANKKLFFLFLPLILANVYSQSTSQREENDRDIIPKNSSVVYEENLKTIWLENNDNNKNAFIILSQKQPGSRLSTDSLTIIFTFDVTDVRFWLKNDSLEISNVYYSDIPVVQLDPYTYTFKSPQTILNIVCLFGQFPIKRILVKENVSLSIDSTFSFQEADANRKITFNPVDEYGQTILISSTNKIKYIFSIPHFSLSSYLKQNFLYVSDFHNAELLSGINSANESDTVRIHSIQFPLISSLNHDTLLTNNPANFIERDIEIKFPPNTTSRKVWLYDAYTMSGFLYDYVYSLFKEYNSLSSKWFGKLFVNDEHYPLNTFTIDIEDYMTFSVNPEGIESLRAFPFRIFDGKTGFFLGEVPSSSSYMSQPGEKIKYGYAPIFSNGLFLNNADNNTKIETYTQFFDSYNRRRPYDSGQSIITINDSFNNSLYSGILSTFDSLTVLPGKYKAEIVNNSYYVGDLQGIAILNSEFNLTGDDANPPVLTSLRLLDSDGILQTDTVDHGSITIQFSAVDLSIGDTTINDYVYHPLEFKNILFDSTALLVKSHNDTTWESISLNVISQEYTPERDLYTSNIRQYSSRYIYYFPDGVMYQAVFDTLPDVLDLKIKIMDDHLNTTEWILKPAFFSKELSTNIVPNENPISSKIKLNQNYPNPFNPSTTIRFTLPTAADAELSVLNIRGQVVTEILDERRSAGEHLVVFDSSKLPSGIYFYRLTTGQFSETRKMVVVR